MRYGASLRMPENTDQEKLRIWTLSRDTEYLSVFSPNAEKYGPEKTPYLDTFHAVNILHKDRFRYAARGKRKQKLRFQKRTKQKHFEPESSLKNKSTPQLAFTCSKVTIEILEEGVKYVQS